MAWAAWAVPLALTVISSIRQGNANAAQANGAAQSGEYNAGVDLQNADNARLAADANEEAQRRRDALTMGAQKASLAENGIDLTSGTGADLVHDSAVNAELNALNIRYSGKMQARQYDQQAVLDRYGANTYRVNAGNAQIAGVLSAGAGALTSTSRYIQYKTLRDRTDAGSSGGL